MSQTRLAPGSETTNPQLGRSNLQQTRPKVWVACPFRVRECHEPIDKGLNLKLSAVVFCGRDTGNCSSAKSQMATKKQVHATRWNPSHEKMFTSLASAVPEKRIGRKFPLWLFNAPMKSLGSLGMMIMVALL